MTHWQLAAILKACLECEGFEDISSQAGRVMVNLFANLEGKRFCISVSELKR